MIDQVLKIVVHYEEETPITDVKTGEVSEGHQLVIVGKSIGDEKEYTHNLPLDPSNPSIDQLNEWRDKGQYVVVSASTVRANPFLHRDKDDAGNPMKYPQPGKVFKVAGNKTVEVGTVLSFSSYAIREATAEDRQRAEEANGRFNKRRQEARMASIDKKKQKSHERTQLKIQEAKAKKK
ncbi:MAG: hypothetical protein H0X24_22620 [Ktedonobacterales bacterium]|nr:hypothetical protein [Ktedonobacterales bacterium]